MKVYRIITAEKGIKELEVKIPSLFNQGLRLAGGIAFNQNYPYQAMIDETIKSGESRKKQETKKPKEIKILSANEAMKRLDDIL